MLILEGAFGEPWFGQLRLVTVPHNENALFEKIIKGVPMENMAGRVIPEAHKGDLGHSDETWNKIKIPRSTCFIFIYYLNL